MGAMEDTGRMEREPTQDERLGMEWWNALSEVARGDWLRLAQSARPADAWAAFKHSLEGESKPGAGPT